MLQRKLQEHHYTNYLEKTIRYQCALGKFAAQFVSRPVSAAKALPPYRPVPTARWLLDVYVSDVHSRLEVLKAKVTSTFGTILKMGSNKRVVKKLAGEAAGTAAWSINVGNEHGQVLMSVLTASEASEGLWNKADGLMKRFESAGMPEPKLLYVNQDCCGKSHTEARNLFPKWKHLVVRLDIWHFMRRLDCCVSSESHPLYATFLRKLSAVIFQWDEGDVKRLQEAKAKEIQSRGLRLPVELTSKELNPHCRRKTRGAVETEALIDEILTIYNDPRCSGDGGPD
ncbi:hypothetical protein ElyMa_006576000 [Elysia marginata]|uniref:DUF6729 domain-containing protein n=1 Tax=Elysia marginata TaxID=1093978 RepID=A0AAV4ICW3_9GAST|nr:hypothetical protein ElyMa_006576000 [Elysia marginata]